MLVKDVDVDLIKSNVLVPIISLVQMGIPLAIGIVVIYDIVVDDGSLLAELSNLIGVSEPTYDAAGKVEVDYADMYDLWVLVTGVSTIMLLLSIGAFVAVMWVLNIMIRWALLGLGYPVAWLLNKTIGSTLRRSAWGDDLDAEDVGRVGPAPPLFARAFDSLPSEISEPLSTHSESNAILTLRKLRAVLGQPEGDGEPPPLKWSAPMIRKAEDHRWPLRDPNPKRLS